MKPKNWVYYISKFTLIDEVLGFIYWGLSIYGIFLITDNIKNQTFLIAALCIYIVSVVIIYITILRKIKLFFKGNPE